MASVGVLLALLMVPTCTALRTSSKKREPEAFPEGRDELDDQELEYELELAQKFSPTKELSQAWLGKNKKFAASTMSLPAQCTEEIKKWATAVKTSHSEDKTNGVASPECADPFAGKESCSKAYELPMYRLGDAILYGKCKACTGKLHTYISKFFPKSIVAKYLTKIGTKKDVQIDKLSEVLDDQEFSEFEKPRPDEMVVHLRLGDSYQHMLRGDGYYKGKASGVQTQHLNITTVTLVYGDHNIKQLAALDGKEAPEKAYQKIYDRIDQIERDFTSYGLKVNKRVNFNADCDTIYMGNARYFVRAGGGFSDVMTGLVKRRGGKVL